MMNRFVKLQGLTLRWLRVNTVAVALVAGHPTLAQQPPLMITLPGDGSLVTPGQVVAVAVTSAPGVNVAKLMIVGEDPIGFSSLASVAPFQFSVAVPSTARVRKYRLTAVGRTVAGREIYSNPITLDVERSDFPSKLFAGMRHLTFEAQGQHFPVRISAEFPDASVLDVTESSNVTFSSSNDAVASINALGVVTSNASGAASVTATYTLLGQTLQVAVPVLVPPLPVTLSPSNVAFGSQSVGTTSTAQSLILTNTGVQAISRVDIVTSGDFAEKDDCAASLPIAPGRTCVINVTFAPTGPGARIGKLSVNNMLTVVPATADLTGKGTIVPFGTLKVETEISRNPPYRFEVKGTFALGVGTDGINLGKDAVTLQIDTIALGIPGGSFRSDASRRFSYEGVVTGIPLEFQIVSLGGNNYRFSAEGRGVDLTGLATPLTIALTIGGNSGSALAGGLSSDRSPEVE
jgi:hypothetical protein